MRGADRSIFRHVERLLLLALAAMAGATLLAGMARLGWPAELASHFRPQYLGLLVLLALAFSAARRPALALVATVLAMPHAWQVVPYLVPQVISSSVAAPMAAETRVVALNLLHRNFRLDGLLRYLSEVNADVLVLSELTPSHVAELRSVLERYPYWMALPRESAWGLGVYSRYPLDDAQWTGLGITGSANLLATLRLPGGDVRMAALHLSSPTSPDRMAMRDRQLDQLAEALGDERDSRLPRLVVGDLNVTVFSPALRDFLAATGLADARRDFGLLGTWPVRWPIVQIPIDHFLSEPGMGVTRVARGPNVGSDHYPLEISFRQSG